MTNEQFYEFVKPIESCESSAASQWGSRYHATSFDTGIATSTLPFSFGNWAEDGTGICFDSSTGFHTAQWSYSDQAAGCVLDQIGVLGMP